MRPGTWCVLHCESQATRAWVNNQPSPGEGTLVGNKRRSSKQKLTSAAALENSITVIFASQEVQLWKFWKRNDLVNKPVLSFLDMYNLSKSENLQSLASLMGLSC